MARGKSNGVMYQNPFNETDGGNPDVPDVNGDKLYYTYDEAMAMQLQGQDLQSTPNTRASEGMMGGPSVGEVNPAGLKQ